jgi:ubiquinol-cytochrome c reductase iron-sulfur subunit
MPAHSDTVDGHGTSGTPKTRRDFLYLATGAMGAVGVALAAWPFIDSMEPAADTLAAGGPIDVDLAQLKPGQQILVRWRSQPIFVLRRTPEALASLRDPAVVARLRDPNSEVNQQGAYATNWHRSIKPEYLILVGICTHLGCIPTYTPKEDGAGAGLPASWPGGYFCHCHGSRYDLAGRVFQGVPAPYNLPVPPYSFTGATSISVGENPPNTIFDFGDIVQI